MSMLFRFSLYGFLKNLRFFEAFMLMFLRDKGLSFTEIGFLFAFREVCVNTLNIPTGAIADLHGRKKSLILALIAYIVSFIMFSFTDGLILLFVAMFLFGIGESFRSGTHKAMIFDYLRQHDMTSEKTRIYGITRSWSQKGSALSVIIGALIVYFGASYKYIFIFSIIPYLIGIWNIYMYPDYLDKRGETGANMREIFNHLVLTTKKCWQQKPLRALITQSTIYEGQYRSVKDYLQVLIQNLALLIPLFGAMVSEQKVAIVSAPIFFVLYLVSSYASKSSHLVVKYFGSEVKSIHAIMYATFVLLFLTFTFSYFDFFACSIVTLVLIYNLQNIMRPIMTARYDDLAASEEQATVLSVEAQANSVGIFIIAPLLGFLADNAGLPFVFLACAMIVGGYLLYLERSKRD